MGKCLSGICGMPGKGKTHTEIVNPSFDSKKHVHHCVILLGTDGSATYFDRDDSSLLVAVVRPGMKYEDVIDKRNPPFFQILPCPYCGVMEDRDHDPWLHVNPKLGFPSHQKT